jgi:hypothetical protein
MRAKANQQPINRAKQSMDMDREKIKCRDQRHACVQK